MAGPDGQKDVVRATPTQPAEAQPGLRSGEALPTEMRGESSYATKVRLARLALLDKRSGKQQKLEPTPPAPASSSDILGLGIASGKSDLFDDVDVKPEPTQPAEAATTTAQPDSTNEERTGDGAEMIVLDAQGNRVTPEQMEADRLASSPGMKAIDANEAKNAAAAAKARAEALAAKKAAEAAEPKLTPQEIAAKKNLERQLKLYRMAKENPGFQAN